jgi:hypothetical protein
MRLPSEGRSVLDALDTGFARSRRARRNGRSIPLPYSILYSTAVAGMLNTAR